jgi:hypothetical protein
MTQGLAAEECKRLSSRQDGWKLARSPAKKGRRTRGGGKGRPNLEMIARRKSLETSSESSEDETVVEDEVAEEPPVEQVVKPTKPANTRVLLEMEELLKAFEQVGCPKCGSPIAMKARTVCIATSIGLECTKEKCEFLYHGGMPAPTTMHADLEDSFERTTDYAINVLYVLGFISLGDGPTEAGRLLGLLGLPNDTTMESRSFGIVEERLGPVLRSLCEEIVKENLIEEARLSMESSLTQDEFDFNLWKESLEDPLMVLPKSKMPLIDASFDMAWQQKGSGHQYNSQSGHGTLMGRLTRKVVGLSIKCKICNQCNTHERKFPGMPMPLHTCWKNHEGTSGSMESAACLELVVHCFQKRNSIVRWLCCDDDSSIRADCQWNNADFMRNNNTTEIPLVPLTKGNNKGKLQQRKDNGKLPFDVPEPKFVADPNHRRKGLTGELIKLDMSRKDIKLTMTRMDSTRIGKNFGYMARTLKQRPQEEFQDAAASVLEHHFDNHVHCGDWCKRKNETEEDRKRSVKYYRCKTKDAKLYGLLHQTIARFVTDDRLIEMAHTLDTNMNEAFNQICTWFAPKNKVFAGSYSLHNRISFAVGINSLGVLEFFKRLFRRLGITMTENVVHYLKIKEDTRIKKLAKVKTSTAKKDKNKRKYEKLKEHTIKAKLERHKRQGTYRKGMNLDDPVEVVDNAEDDNGAGRKPAAKKQKKSTGYCEYCGQKGHLQKRSKKCQASLDSCKKYRRIDGTLLTEPPRVVQPVAQPNDADDDVLDCENFDAMPLVEMPGEEFSFDIDDLATLAIDGLQDGESDDDSVQLVRAVL